MRIAFWCKRFFLMAVPVFAILSAVYLARGQAAPAALRDSALWSLITASVFVATRIYQLRRGRECALCNDGINPTSAV